MRSGASVVWTINSWTPAQLAIFTINIREDKRQIILSQGTTLLYVSSWFHFNVKLEKFFKKPLKM